MLSRTAESLFWAARYMERADNVARRLEVGYRMALMPMDEAQRASEWASILATTHIREGFDRHFDAVSQANVEQYLIYHSDNPSSISTCIRSARNNARSVRTALTSDVWTAVNQTYLEFLKFEKSPSKQPDLPSLCDWVKRQAATVRGAFVNTQLNDDGYDFYHLGYFIERANNTAQLLDIKYHLLLPTIEMVGGGVDNYQWTTLLRGLSAYRSFHWAYHGDFSPDKIADFLILNESCPRSLYFCLAQVTERLRKLEDSAGPRSEQQGSTQQGSALASAEQLLAKLQNTDAANILSDGLHEYLVDFIISNNQLAIEIGETFLFGEK